MEIKEITTQLETGDTNFLVVDVLLDTTLPVSLPIGQFTVDGGAEIGVTGDVTNHIFENSLVSHYQTGDTDYLIRSRFALREPLPENLVGSASVRVNPPDTGTAGIELSGLNATKSFDIGTGDGIPVEPEPSPTPPEDDGIYGTGISKRDAAIGGAALALIVSLSGGN